MKFYSRSTKKNHAKTVQEFSAKTAVKWFKHRQYVAELHANKPIQDILAMLTH